MTSSMSTGDRRWASSTRRSGMTVLGKVAVPKPINLPSQKLENHGLDPNVEIVPKGTHSWGSKPSSQTNAWGLSSVSPNTDGGTGSPSHLSGCPSSGGSNTRPSTAGSDGPHEPAVNAWGPNSRPSSASGALSSNHSSLSTLRPHSAETQPGSSQLSRFAEPLSVNPVARGGSTDKGISSSKNNFSLTSGDFPTLGSEKEKIENTGLEGDANVTASSNSEATNTWRRDEERFGKDVMPSEMRQEDVHSFPNASMPPNHYEAWHGPPVNNPSGGTWYRGPPYGAPLPPGSFPMEPFPYYRPHFPPNALVNSQLRGAGPRVHHPMSADMQRPLMPDPYLRPGLPIRPGFCPGPVPYESYYGPPMGYCNRSKQNKPFMGFPRGSVYNELPRQNGPDPANSHARSGGHTGKASAMGQVESDHFHDSSGPFKILTKQHNGSDRHMLEDPVTTSFEKGDHHKKSGRSGWEADNKKDEMIATQRAEQSETPDRHTESNSFAMLSSGIVGNRKQPDIRSTERMEMPASALAVSQSTAADPKDSCLIKKIDGLNSKARSSDARPEVLSDCSREEQNTKSQIYPRASFPANSGGTGLLPSKGLQPFETRKPVNSRADFTSRSYSGKQNRFETTPAAEGNVSGVYLGTDANSQEHHADAEGRERPATYSQKKLWGGPSRQTLNANEFRGQEHVEMRMSAELHSTSLQNKGEHVTKQKANATEIPKEIDRHCYGVQDSKQKLETFSAGASMNKKEDSCTVTETNLIVGTVVCPNKPHSSAPNPNFVSPVTIGDANRSERPTSNENVLERRPKNAHKESAAVEKQPLSFQMEVNNLDAGVRSNVLPNHGNAAAKDKHSGYKHKQNVPLESSLANCTLSSGNDVGLNCHPDEANEVTTQEVTCEIAPISESSVHAGKKAISESLGHQKRRSNWTGKGKQRVYEDPALTSRKAEIRNTSVEPVESELVFSSIQAGTDSKDAIPTPAQHIHVRNEETPDGINSQWKSQHSGAMSRNPQSTRSSGKFNNADAVVWAPVCSQNKNGVINHDSSQNRSEVTDDGTDRKTVPEVAPLKKVDQYVRTNPKSKRAEMERYVPKPVAKEMAQQASNQQPAAPSHGQFAEGETVEGVESDLQSVENPQHVRTTIVKGSLSIRHNNQGKTQASWRPRSSESANTQVLQDGSSYSLKTGKYKSINAKPDSVPGKEQSDGWNIQHNPDSVPHANLVKNHDATAREKRHFYKGHRGAVNSHDRVTKNNNEGGDNTKTHSPAPDMIQADFTSAKENCNAAERVASHWQHNPRGTSHRRGGRSTGRDDIWTNKSDYLPHTGVPLQKHREAHQVIVEPHTGHAVSEKSHEVPDQFKREKKPSSSGGRPQSTNQASADLTESASVTTDTRHEQLTFSHGNVKTNWFSRGHGSSSKWSIPEQSSRKDDQSGNWERQRSNTSYQYKPVAPYNNRPNDNKGPEDGSQETGSMYVERGQRHSRRGRGNLYGQQRRHIHVDAGRD